MDRVRLGRALGYGTRHAAKTMAAVVEAVTTEHPQVRTPASAADQVTPFSGSDPARPAARPRPAAPRVGQGMRQLKHSFWQPLVAFSGALWLRVTGLFFALLAFTLGSAAWRLRGTLPLGLAHPGAHRFWLFAGFAVLFGYFAVSSFVRASLKERRAASGGR